MENRNAEPSHLRPSSNRNDAKQPTQPSLSVCIATYNGSDFIRQQITSILEQALPIDEMIIVDDASVDRTVEVVRSFKDPRIQVFQNPKNIGVIRSFEKAIEHATGDIIFLSDQDDVWRPQKTMRFVQIFQDPTITVAQSDAIVIDARGHVLETSYMKTRGGFVSGVFQNIYRSRYLGCTMAFRKEVLRYSLPFPKNIPMHDVWIGIVNAWYGKTAFINEPLIEYRRHEKNVSGPGQAAKRIQWRAGLLVNLMKLVFQARHT